MRSWYVAASAVLLALLASTAAATQEPSLRAEIVSLSEAEYPQVRLVVNVEDTSASPGDALSAENFAVSFDDQPAPVLTADLASSQDAPLDLLVIVDTSGSMAGTPLAAAKDALKTLVNELPPNDRIAVMSFGDQVAVVQDYTEDRALVGAAIDGLVAQGNTALYQATAAGAFKAATSPAQRRAVVLLSDGADFGGVSTFTRDQAISGAAGSGVPFFTIAYGTDLDRAYLTDLAGISKGRFLEAPAPGDIGALYAGIGRLLRSQYVVTVDGSDITGTAAVPVRVRVTVGDQAADAVGTYIPGASRAPTVVTITGVQPGEAIAEPREIVVSAQGGQPVTRVVFLVDDRSVFETTSEPYIFVYDPASYGPGAHEIVVVAEAPSGLASADVTITSNPPSSGGGRSYLPLVGAAVLILGVGAAGGLFLRARRHPTGGEVPVSQRITPWATQVVRGVPPPPSDEPVELEPESVGEPLGVLVERSGPGAGREYTVGASPVSIGSGSRCAVRIDDPSLAAEEARTWVRSGHLMLHKITRLTAIAYEGTSGGWVILEPGDSFDIGEHLFEFKLLPAPQALRDDAAASGDVDPSAPGTQGTPKPPPEPRPLRLAELMPRNDLDEPPAQRDQRAS